MEEESNWDEILGEGEGGDGWKVMGVGADGWKFKKERQSTSVKNIHRRDWYTIGLWLKSRSEIEYKSLSVKTVHLS